MLNIPYPSGTTGLPIDVDQIARGVLNRVASIGGLALRRAGGVVTGLLWPSNMGDGTLFGAVAALLQKDQVRWVQDVAAATGADELLVGQELVDQLAVWEYAHPGVAPPKSLYDDVIMQAQAAAAPSAGPTPGNVRISRVLATTLGACAALACPPPADGYGGGAHGCTKYPKGDTLDSHHMPADAPSPLDTDMGPAIRMRVADHRMTSSYGVGATGAAGAFVRQGQVLAAFNLDAAEVERLFPGRYTASIAQARLYAECLRAHGIIR